MSKHRLPKTEGYTWLEHSFNSFNGSGYANRDSAEEFVESYIDYEKFKKRSNGVELANQYYVPLLAMADYFIEESFPIKTISDKNWQKFNNFVINSNHGTRTT